MEQATPDQTTAATGQSEHWVPCIELTCLTIAECTPVAEQIRSHLSQHPTIAISLSACEEIDTAGLQLLTILRCDDDIRDRIAFDQPHEAVVKGIQMLGLGRALGFELPSA